MCNLIHFIKYFEGTWSEPHEPCTDNAVSNSENTLLKWRRGENRREILLTMPEPERFTWKKTTGARAWRSASEPLFIHEEADLWHARNSSHVNVTCQVPYLAKKRLFLAEKSVHCRRFERDILFICNNSIKHSTYHVDAKRRCQTTHINEIGLEDSHQKMVNLLVIFW